MYFTTPLFLLLLRTATAAPAAPPSSTDIPYLPCPEDHPLGNYGPVCEPRPGATGRPNEPVDPRLGGTKITPYHDDNNNNVDPELGLPQPSTTEKKPTRPINPLTKPANKNPDGSVMIGPKDDTKPSPFPCPDGWPSDFGIGPVCTPQETQEPKVEPPPCPDPPMDPRFGPGPVCTPQKPRVTPPPCPEGTWPANFGKGPVCTPNKPADGDGDGDNNGQPDDDN